MNNDRIIRLEEPVSQILAKEKGVIAIRRADYVIGLTGTVIKDREGKRHRRPTTDERQRAILVKVSDL